MTRAFVAVALPEPVLDTIAQTTATVDLQFARRTTREQWHLTLHFLGDVADVDAIGDALAGLPIVADVVRLGGGGAFPEPRRATVCWLGVRQGSAFLQRLAAEIGRRLRPLGYVPEDRPFHPHVTVARTKRPVDLRAAVAHLERQPDGPPWTVADVVVFESQLAAAGARYVALRTITLRASP